jgi:DNA polymerase-1
MLVRNRLEPLMWVNENLIECMEWQELDEIKHPLVKLGGELSVFHPSWEIEHKIPKSFAVSKSTNTLSLNRITLISQAMLDSLT